MKTPRKNALVLLSGGLDSLVNLAIAVARDDVEPVLALTFDYGQRAAEREIESARRISAHYKIEHAVIGLPWIAEFCESALTGSSEIPTFDELPEDEDAIDSAAAVWVANRNGIFVNVAAAVAEARGIELVVAGFNAEEARTFPDNSPEFVSAANALFEYSIAGHVRLVSFTIDEEKAEIYRKGLGLCAPIEAVWSCYSGGPESCLRCESCLRFSRARDAVRKDGLNREGV